MKPFSYSFWATCIVYLAEKPSFRLASCWRVVVRKGAYGLRVYGLLSTDVTEYVELSRRCARARAACSSRWRVSGLLIAPVLAKSRPWATLRPSTPVSVALKVLGSSSRPVSKSACRSQ